tara:strand:+ start:852 stop:1085 length:234 start_codon:yes stop_codon:yes gene_type:complete
MELNMKTDKKQIQHAIKDLTYDLKEIMGDSHKKYNPGGDDRNLNPRSPVYAWRMFTAKSGRDYEIQVRPIIQPQIGS